MHDQEDYTVEQISLDPSSINIINPLTAGAAYIRILIFY